MTTQPPERNGARAAGSAFGMGYITGCVALVGALISLGSRDLSAMALCLLAAALAFGSLANAALRQ
jgi:hypothetical protein